MLRGKIAQFCSESLALHIKKIRSAFLSIKNLISGGGGVRPPEWQKNQILVFFLSFETPQKTKKTVRQKKTPPDFDVTFFRMRLQGSFPYKKDAYGRPSPHKVRIVDLSQLNLEIWGQTQNLFEKWSNCQCS